MGKVINLKDVDVEKMRRATSISETRIQSAFARDNKIVPTSDLKTAFECYKNATTPASKDLAIRQIAAFFKK
ncbi:MAG: hypothetical protein WCO84_02550 [bacterium]